MALYESVTMWRITAPLDAVWEAISHSEQWPGWWRGVERVVELEKGDAAGVGNLRRYTWKGVLPYRLIVDIRTTRIVTAALIEGAASGDVEGIGLWRFSREEAVTAVRHEWRVRLTRLDMRALLLVARPLVRLNHEIVMRRGGLGLARHLGARLCGMEYACLGA